MMRLLLTLYLCALPLLSVDLATVEKIYVDEMGKSEDGGRFRLLLEEELLKRGFQVVSKDKADAVLVGTITVHVYAQAEAARADRVAPG